MSLQPKTYLTSEQYLAIERDAEYKSEFYQGEMFAMAGASRQHSLIMINLGRELSTQLKGNPCTTYSSDTRVKVNLTGLYTYPDVTVVCGKAEFDDEHNDTLTNPTVLIEILSKSTEAYDRGEKFAQYRTLDSLKEYLLVAQDQYRIERFTRQSNGQWLLSEAIGPDSRIQLESIDCTLALAEVYDKVEFP
jgi:Uma2 family endonuclease